MPPPHFAAHPGTRAQAVPRGTGLACEGAMVRTLEEEGSHLADALGGIRLGDGGAGGGGVEGTVLCAEHLLGRHFVRWASVVRAKS